MTLLDAIAGTTPTDAPRPGNPVDDPERQHTPGTQREGALGVATAQLRLAAAVLDEIEGVRIAQQNRLRALVADGLTAVPTTAAARIRLEDLEDLEHRCELDLKRALRLHPLGPWVRRTLGVGEKQGARLIAAIGDPAWNAASDRPRRGPAELWAYCGLHTVPPGASTTESPSPKNGTSTGRVAAARRKGVRANWNAEAKARAYLVAASCMKCRTSPYRAVYDTARMDWAERETTDLHKHNHALRLVAKAVLKDLWRESRRLRSEI